MLILTLLLADTNEGWTVHYYVAILEDSGQYYTPQPGTTEEPNPNEAEEGISNENLNGALTLYNTNGGVSADYPRQIIITV